MCYNQVQTTGVFEEFSNNLLLLLQNETNNILKAREKRGRKRNIFYELARRAVRSRGFICLAPWWGSQLSRVHSTNIIFEGVTPITTTAGVGDYHNAYGILDIILAYARCYIEDVSDKFLVLRKLGTNEIIKIPYLTRFSSGYYSSIAAKIVKLAQVEQFECGIFMTLTLNPSLYSNEEEACKAITSEINRLITWARKNGEVLRGWKGQYLSVVEFQNNGMPHYHIMFFGAKWADVPRIRDEYEAHMGKGTFFHVRYVEPEWHEDKDGKLRKTTAIHYMLKYMWKSAGNFTHKTLLWALGIRAYNTSRGLLAFIFNKRLNNSNAKWVYLGAHPAFLAKTWVTYDDYLRDVGQYTG